MTLREQQEEFALDVSRLIMWAFRNGYTVTFGEAYRTKEQAEWNVAHGVGILNSLHRDRLAIDLNLFKNGVYSQFDTDYKPLGDYWESLHPLNRWGGRFSDGNHFERRKA